MANEGRPFTQEDRETLKRLNGEGFLVSEIAEKMARSPGMISKYMQHMRLVRNSVDARRAQRLERLREKVKRAPKGRPEPDFQPKIIEDPLLSRLQAGRR